MSVTKSVASIAVAMLVEDGVLALDMPLTTWFPEVPGEFGTVTLRDLLAGTSGIDPCADLRECAAMREDAVAFALTGPVSERVWAYNNNAPNLLAAIVERATGTPLDQWLDARLFADAGIRSARWEHDWAGTPFVTAGLSLSAPDLVRLGDVLLDRPETLTAFTTPQPEHPWYGLLWWPVYRAELSLSDADLDYWQGSGVPSSTVDALRPLAGDTWRSFPECVAAQIQALGGGPVGTSAWYAVAWRQLPMCEPVRRVVGFAARGDLGQYLVVLPEDRVVAVRLRHTGRLYRERDADPAWPERVALVVAGGSPEDLPPWAWSPPP